MDSAGGVDVGILPVPGRGTAEAATRLGDEIYVHRMRMVITVTGTESQAGLADFFNRFVFKCFWVKINGGSSTPPTLLTNVGIWDTSGFAGTSAAILAPMSETLKAQTRPIFTKYGEVYGIDYTVATSNIAGMKGHIWTKVINVTFKRPVKVQFSSVDTNAQSTFRTAMPVFAYLSDSSVTPSPTLRYQTRWWYSA